jgi:glycosyltransferase A (GT-A) superfamily protein (DUF2064 family)
MLDKKTGSYLQQMRESVLWDKMLRELGEDEAERMLKVFRIEIR